MEQMKLFRSAGVNPLGGCIPALLQIPIFFALFSFFNSEVGLRGAEFLWSSDLSAPDMVIYNLEGIHHEATDTYTPTATIVLADQNEVEYMFRAFCLDYHKSNPKSSDTFNLSGTASVDVVKVLNGLSGLAASVTNNEAIQVAIWVVTQNISHQDLDDHFSDGLYEIDNAKGILTAAGIDTTGKQLFVP
jgi:membrane protein insertase Oxa1/YidC/SpoIIIJ